MFTVSRWQTVNEDELAENRLASGPTPLDSRVAMRPPCSVITERSLIEERSLITEHPLGYNAIVRKELKTTRWSDLQGALAVAVLEARAEHDNDIVIELPSVTGTTLRAAREFMARVAPDATFSLEGRDGTRAGSAGSDGDAPTTLRRARAHPPREKKSVGGELFTDMHQWLLKFLLLAPTTTPRPASLRELAAAATAGGTTPSLTSVQRFVEAFTDIGHLVRDVDGFKIIRRAELMRRWLARMEMMRDARIPIRPHYGTEAFLQTLAGQSFRNVATSTSKTASAALGGFAACDARHVLHVLERGRPEVHVDGRAMGEVWHHAERCSRKDATLFIIPSAAFALSIYGPLTWEKAREGELQPVDLIQAALDVWTHPMGGQEQAHHIVDDVLGYTDQ